MKFTQFVIGGWWSLLAIASVTACANTSDSSASKIKDGQSYFTIELVENSIHWIEFPQKLEFRDFLTVATFFEGDDSEGNCEKTSITLMTSNKLVEELTIPSSSDSCSSSRNRISSEAYAGSPYSAMLITPNTEAWYLWRSSVEGSGILNVDGPLRIGVSCTETCVVKMEKNGSALRSELFDRVR